MRWYFFYMYVFRCRIWYTLIIFFASYLSVELVNLTEAASTLRFKKCIALCIKWSSILILNPDTYPNFEFKNTVDLNLKKNRLICHYNWYSTLIWGQYMIATFIQSNEWMFGSFIECSVYDIFLLHIENKSFVNVNKKKVSDFSF